MRAFYNFLTLYILILLISISSNKELDKNELKIETFPESIKKEFKKRNFKKIN